MYLGWRGGEVTDLGLDFSPHSIILNSDSIEIVCITMEWTEKTNNFV